MLANGKLSQGYDTDGSGRDNLGFDRWTHMKFIGKGNRIFSLHEHEEGFGNNIPASPMPFD